jgi:hypothetical protein
MSFWVAGAMVGSAVIGAVSSNKAASKSAKAQQKGIDAQNALLGPYSEAGQAGLGGVQSFVDNGARFSDTQAFKDITNSAKAGGQYLSGNRATALTDYYATNFRPQRLNELMQLPTLGANASAGQATNLGNMYTGLGQTQAAGILGAGNSAQNGLNSLAFMNMYNQGQGLSGSAGKVQPGQHGYGGIG